MADETDVEINVSDVLGKSNLRASYTTLTYISDDVTSPEYVSPDFNDSFDSTVVERQDKDIVSYRPKNDVTSAPVVDSDIHDSSSAEEQTDTRDNVDINNVHVNNTTNNDETQWEPIHSPPVIDVNEQSNIYITSSNTVPPTTLTNGRESDINDSRPITIVSSPQTLYSGQPQTTTSTVTSNPDPVREGSFHNVQYVQTRHRSTDEPLTKRRILLLKIFSVVAAIVFFPIGLFAVRRAFKIEKVFEEGVLAGDIDRALKLARKTQTLIILSITVGVFFIVVVLTIIERVNLGKQNSPRGAIVGH